jgi:hypothetical protein
MLIRTPYDMCAYHNSCDAFPYFYQIRLKTAGIVNRLWAEQPRNHGQILSRWKILLQSIQTGSGAHPAAYSTGTRTPSSRNGLDHFPVYTVRLRMSAAIPLLPDVRSWNSQRQLSFNIENSEKYKVCLAQNVWAFVLYNFSLCGLT